MSKPLLIGAEDQSTYITMIDSTTGLRKTDAVYNSAGISMWYRRSGGSLVSITLATLANVNSAHTDGGFIHIGNGVYRLDLPDAAAASGAVDVQIGGGITGGTVFGHLHQLVGQAWTAATMQITLPSIPNNWITAAGINAGALDGKGDWRTAATYPSNFAALGINSSGHIARVVLVDTTTTNSDMRGTDGALLSVSYEAPDNGGIAAIGLTVDGIADVFSGVTNIAEWLGAIAGKTADATTRAEINATTAGATYNETTDSLEAIRDRGDAAWSGGGGGGCGDATFEMQQEILAALQGAQVLQVPSPNVSGNLVLTQGDTYDGIGNPRAQWVVSTDYTDGWLVTLTIRDNLDAVIYTTEGDVVSDTLVAVTIEAPTGLEMTGCPGQWQGKFDVQLSKGASVLTIALGTCYINEDQTR